MQRVILHSDLNHFYAAVECLHNPSLAGKPVAVGGDPALRHGIILAKNPLAKASGVTTGQAIWQARQCCPSLVVLPPNHRLYLRFARMARDIYRRYTDRVEPYGLDEAWLDVTGSAGLFGNGKKIADELRQRIRRELGLTVSIGVANNKAFAKLGSDIKKPDATTVLEPENYPETVWPLPAGDLLYVGRATARKMANWGIYTIGDIARLEPGVLRHLMGKNGELLWSYARGLDTSPVAEAGARTPILSIGNSTTTPRDLTCLRDVRTVLYLLSESVASRMREHGLYGRTLALYVRDTELEHFERQCPLPRTTHISGELARTAEALFSRSYGWRRPIRSLGLRCANLVSDPLYLQCSLLEDNEAFARQETLERTVDDIRRRFGPFSIRRALSLQDNTLEETGPEELHLNLLHPDSSRSGDRVLQYL
ncbi:MAG: DNA polymerase IV [Christensenellales bacterium]|jgi:DNA polymerase-4